MRRALALLLLVAGLGTFYAWQWVPADRAGTVFALGTHGFILLLLGLLAVLLRDALLGWVLGLLAASSAMVVGCNTAFLISPWPVHAAEELCSARLNVPLGIVGLVLFVVLAGGVYMHGRRRGEHGPP